MKVHVVLLFLLYIFFCFLIAILATLFFLLLLCFTHDRVSMCEGESWFFFAFLWVWAAIVSIFTLRYCYDFRWELAFRVWIFFLVCFLSLFLLAVSGFGIIVWYFWFVWFFFFIFCTNFFAKLFQYPLLVEDDLCVCVSVYCVLVWFGVTSLCESDKRRKRTSFFLF